MRTNRVKLNTFQSEESKAEMSVAAKPYPYKFTEEERTLNYQMFGTAEPDYKALYELAKKEAAEKAALAQQLQKEQAARIAEAPAADQVSSVEEFLDQRVPIMLYKDAEKYKDDVVIAINGEKIQIQRGIQVYVKRKFLHIIENQYRQQMVAADLQDSLADQYASDSRLRGINI
jgi:hypothetical protein